MMNSHRARSVRLGLIAAGATLLFSSTTQAQELSCAATAEKAISTMMDAVTATPNMVLLRATNQTIEAKKRGVITLSEGPNSVSCRLIVDVILNGMLFATESSEYEASRFDDQSDIWIEFTN